MRFTPGLACLILAATSASAFAQAPTTPSSAAGRDTGTRPAAAGRSTTPGTVADAGSRYPGNPRLDASGRKLDRQIKRGICVGC
jgi:hypothetical protein